MQSGVETISSRGTELVIETFGYPMGHPVLLVPGGGQTRHAWAETAIALGKSGWLAITMDQRGHGDSSWSTTGSYLVRDFAADIRCIAALLHRPPVLIGASLGGMAALLAIGDRSGPSEIATGLILVDVTARLERAGSERVRNFMLKHIDGFDTLEDVVDAVAQYDPTRSRERTTSGVAKNVRQSDDGRWYWHWDPRILEPTADPAYIYALEERLEIAARNVKLPTLVVRGSRSDVVSLAGVEHLQSLIPQAIAVDVAGTGHMVAGDDNGAFNTVILAFLEDQILPRLV